MTIKYSSILGILSLYLVVLPCSSYNLEDRLPLFKYGPENSKFGFSVDMHRTTTDDEVGSSGTLLMAGAPTATSVQIAAKYAPNNPGGAFYCPVSTDPYDCSRIDLNEGNDTTITDATRTVVKYSSGQWIGVSLKSLGPGKNLVTCGHRYTKHNYTVVPSKDERQRICGRCFLLKASPEQVEEVLPDSPEFPYGFVSNFCDKFNVDRPGRHDSYISAYGSNQAGVAIAAEDDEFVIGAPGTWTFYGAIFNFDLFDRSSITEFEQSPTCFYQERSKHKSKATCNRLPVAAPVPHIGFSVAMSRAIEETSGKVYFAAGAPTANTTGVVVIFTKGTYRGQPELVPDASNSVGGEKIASSFGFAVAFADVNGDKLDDLIVGAPQYFHYSRKSQVGGAVYVYLNDPEKGFSDVTPKLLRGSDASYFGHSIAALGDLDQDGYEDFAVGAPYEGTNGAVHIFRGGPKGPTASQVIKGSQYSDIGKDIVAFGASLSGRIDADGSKYPDILIGTLSDSMALLRSRPIISVYSNLNIELGGSKNELDLERRRCKSGGARYTCFTLSYCLRYEARLEKYPDGVLIKTRLKLDSMRKDKKLISRLRFDSPAGSDEIVKEKFLLENEGEKVCSDEYTVYFLNGVRDKLTDIKVDFDFDLNLAEIERESVGSPIFNMKNDPILDRDLKNGKLETIRIKNDCGDDGCQSNLKVSAVMSEEVLIGRDSFVFVNVTTSNDGEEAHEASVDLHIPGMLDFIDYKVVSGPAKEIGCASTYRGGFTDIKCLIGNPYKRGMENDISIKLSTRRLEQETKSIGVTVKGSTTSFNRAILPIALQSRVIAELFLSLSWKSQPDQVRYSMKKILGESGMKSTDDIGPHIEYTFTVENTASHPAKGARLKVVLPIETENGKWLLYLVNADVVAGTDLQSGNCSETYVNSLQLELSETDASSISSRQKRSAKEGSEEGPRAEALTGGSSADRLFLSCDRGKARCKTIECDMQEIPPESTSSIVMVMRLWEATFVEEYSEIDLVSILTDASLSAVDSSVRIEGQTSGTVETIVDRELNKTDIQSTFPWWFILIAVVVLSILYIVAIVVLFRLGFFRRRRFHRRDKEERLEVLEDTKM